MSFVVTLKLKGEYMNCKYCNKECKSKISLVNHENLCIKNLNRKLPNNCKTEIIVCEYC